MPKASRETYSHKAYYLLVLPAVLILLLVNRFPLIYSCYISVTNYSLSDPDTSSFMGFNNFVQAFKDPHEAAELDGASGFQKFLHITFPAMRNTMLICILIRGMHAFREYDKVYTMPYGGPGSSTESASFYIYRQGFVFFNTGFSTAISLIMLVLTIIVVQTSVVKLRSV
jgi:ABC-type sugar transport system permease subunit